MNLELHVNLKHAVNINNPCYFPFYEYIQYIKNQTTESTSCAKYIALNHNRYLLQQLIGLESRVFQNILIRAFFFFFTQQDKWIVFGGMIVTCIIMFLVVKYLT